jgi:hypothetical protein
VSLDHLPGALPGQMAPTVSFLADFRGFVNSGNHEGCVEKRQIEFQIHDDRILVDAGVGFGASVLFEDVN